MREVPTTPTRRRPPHGRLVRWWLPCLALLAAACGKSPLAVEIDPLGSWGGDGILVEVTREGARIRLGCATGTTRGPLRLDRQGRFAESGSLTLEGGPVGRRSPPALAVTWEGAVTGNVMTLRIRDQAGNLGETRVLERGARTVIPRCL